MVGGEALSGAACGKLLDVRGSALVENPSRLSIVLRLGVP